MGIQSLKTFNHRPIMVSALVGSHNYCMNRPASDEDYKYLVCPNFQDLYEGNIFTDANQSALVDYSARDIRTFPELLWKGNFAFIEILFSTRVQYTESLFEMFGLRENFTALNPKAFFQNVYFGSLSKVKNIHHGTATTKALIESFAYDVKEAHHALRGFYTLNRYMETGSMAKALRYIDDTEDKRTLMNLKEGAYTESEFLELVENWKSNYYNTTKEFFTAQLQPSPHMYERLQSIVKAAVRIELGL